MKASRFVFLSLLVLCTLIVNSESKLQQQPVEDDDDDDDDEWDEDNNNFPSRVEIDDEGRIYKNPRNSPSAVCPRDEEQAAIVGQKCLRKCSTDEDCKSKKKKCRCDGLCGMSCIKPERLCPELTEIEHGVLTVTNRTFGEKAVYTCDPKYHTVGLSERTCRADGQWTGVTPSCKKEDKSYCTAPNKFPNARHNALPEQTTFDLDTIITYHCNYGFESKGLPKAKCLMTAGVAAWYGPDFTCEAKSCGPPADIANGWHAGECYKYDCHVSYHCADGFVLQGQAEKICIADGTWLPADLPKCVQVASVQCDQPENPVNGKAIYTSVAYNAVVSYECKTGYTIVGASTRRCSSDARWTGQAPSCVEIDCGSPGILYNGWIDNYENGTGMGVSLIFRCKEHMKLEGNSSSVCQMDGKWRYPLPQCLAPCIVPQIARGHVYIYSDTGDHMNNVTIAEHGKRLVVECEADYEFAMAHHQVVCNNGTWSIMPSCSPARCKHMPKPPKNGMVIAPKTDHGMKAVFKCKDGFEMIGGGPFNNSFSLQCQYGNWTGDIPHCIEVFCPFPGYVQNGKVLLVGNMGVYDYRPYVKRVFNNKQIMYDCDKGYFLAEGPPGATCVGGSWSPKELPKCELGQHPRIRWQNARRRRSIEEARNETVVVAYRKFIDFFRKIGKKLLELEMEKSHETLNHIDSVEIISKMNSNSNNNNSLISNNDTSSSLNVAHSGNVSKAREHNGGGGGHGNKPRTRDEKMIDFLRVVYRKLQRIDSRHASNDTNVTMHELLNVMSKNFFHVDLSEPRKNATAKGHETPESKNQREFTKLKREFERIMKFYNKSLRWSEKHLRKDLRKKQKQTHNQKGKQKAGAAKDSSKQDKSKKQHKAPINYKGFYEFINDYVTQKLSALEAQNATEELIKKMKIEKMSSRNGKVFTIAEIYTFFKHIIEAKLNASKASANETVTSTSSSPLPTSSTTEKLPTTTVVITQGSSTTAGATSSSSTSLPSSSSKPPVSLVVSENEIPAALDIVNSQPSKSRSKRIRDASTRSPITEVRRKLLSVDYPLDGGSSDNNYAGYVLPGRSYPDDSSASRAKRFLPAVSSSELEDNQTYLKNLYVNAFEERYRANVKRSIAHLNKQRRLARARGARGSPQSGVHKFVAK